MSEKFFDIIPPKEIKQTRVIRFQNNRNRKSSDFKQKKSFILPLIGLVVLGIGIVFYFILPKAEIIIWPETEIFREEVILTLDKQAGQIDFQNKIVPAQLLVVEKSYSQEFLTSGKIVERRKAEGIIRVYNIYSTNPLSLVANTRFMSEDGKLFRAKRRLTVPGAKRERGRLVPRYVDVEVRAAVYGQEHNIGPSTFSIPGLAGTAKFHGFYGRSYAPMKGGFKGKVLQVTQVDLDLARETVIKKLFADGEKAIKNKAPNNSIFILLNNQAINYQIIKESFTAKVGDKKDSFEFQAKIKSQAAIFRFSDIQKFSKEKILLNIQDTNKNFLEDSLEIDYSFKDNNLEQDKFAMILKIKAEIFSKINQEIIKENIKGKTIQETELFFQDQLGIIKTHVILWPFWVTRVPQDIDKIQIKLEFNS